MERAGKEGEGGEGRNWNKGRIGGDRGPLHGKAVEKGGNEREGGEGRDGNKGRGKRERGPLRGKGVERGGEEEKRSKNGYVSRLRPSSYSLLCVRESNQMKFKHITLIVSYIIFNAKKKQL